MFRKEMTFITKPPTGVQPLIAPGFNPGIRDDYEGQANPKGVEHPQIEQILSLVVVKICIYRKDMTIGSRHSESEVQLVPIFGKDKESLFKKETLHYIQGDGEGRFCHW